MTDHDSYQTYDELALPFEDYDPQRERYQQKIEDNWVQGVIDDYLDDPFGLRLEQRGECGE